MTRTPLLILPLLAACASVLPPGAPVTGSWGGTHVGLTLDVAGGRLEYDCAAGTIGPLVLGDDGRFVAEGTHTPGKGGPDVAGEVQPSYRTRFTGMVRGDRMTLQGRVENGVLLGPFELRRGAEPVIFRCL